MKHYSLFKAGRRLALAQRVVLILLALCAACLTALLFTGGWNSRRTLSVLTCLAILVLLVCAGIINLMLGRSILRATDTMNAIVANQGTPLLEDVDPSASAGLDQYFLAEIRGIVKHFFHLESTQEILCTQTKLVALQNQINPHFLYNTLDVIRSEAIIEGAKNVSDMIQTLSRLFRYGISGCEDLVTVSDELRHVLDYFRIQQYRFMDRYLLRVETPDEPGWEALLLPKLSIQPLVENAILHAFQNQSSPGTITIRVEATGQAMRITVADNGSGMTLAELTGLRARLDAEARGMYTVLGKDTTGIALENINKRIKLFFGDSYGMSVSSFPGVGTDVILYLPAQRQRADHE